jgi:hypothetical protein
MWLYGSGFPKAQDLGAMYDADACRAELAAQLGRTPTREEFKAAWKVFRQSEWYDRYHDGGTRQKLGTEHWQVTSYMGKEAGNERSLPVTDLAREWDGWKVGGIKPAYEPVLWARKPCEGSTMANVLKHGVGAFNADAGRVEGEYKWRASNGDPDKWPKSSFGSGAFGEAANPLGRFPPNLLLDDEAAAMLDEQSGESVSRHDLRDEDSNTGSSGIYEGGWKRKPSILNDTGGASRFFPRFSYTAKACRWEREAGLKGFEAIQVNKMGSFGEQSDFDCPDGAHRVGDKGSAVMANPHPTVKPIRLMRWLLELVTREGDTILDPLCGSGSTGCAAVWTNRAFIGIEKEVEYHAIAEARVAYWALQAGKEYADVQAQWDADSADYPLFAE